MVGRSLFDGETYSHDLQNVDREVVLFIPELNLLVVLTRVSETEVAS